MIGVAIGSGGVYAASGLGVLQVLEEENLIIKSIGGASSGALMSALYFLEGNAKSAQNVLIKKLPILKQLKFNPFSKPVSGLLVRSILVDILDNRDWKDSKRDMFICFAAAYQHSHKPVILTKNSGLKLVDAVLASISLKMIEPVVSLGTNLIAHGGDPEYIQDIKNSGCDLIIGVSPNLTSGFIGKIANLGNELGSILILKKDYFARKSEFTPHKYRVDIAIQPDLSLFPFISPLDFSYRNVELMINKGKKLAVTEIYKIKSKSKL